jgi:2-amino-4-hydroxy-6-hydroxymethyldihydropteridine diphosphokinase
MALTTAYIALGSNLGERSVNIFSALNLLDDQPGIEIAIVSQFIETDPVGGPNHQGKFLNTTAELRCGISAQQLLQTLQSVEEQLGRVRTVKWGPRTIDLDLLLFGLEVIDSEHLKVPHPLMHQRRFVMAPLVEIAPDLVHPVLNKTMRQILDSLETP